MTAYSRSRYDGVKSTGLRRSTMDRITAQNIKGYYGEGTIRAELVMEKKNQHANKLSRKFFHNP